MSPSLLDHYKNGCPYLSLLFIPFILPIYHVVQDRDPETGQLHKFITTLPKSTNPGTTAMLYYKRWTIEKSFNNSESDFNESKAWSSNLNALNNQMRFTAMAYNIMRVLEEISKSNSPKYNQKLDKRQKIAQGKDRFVNPLFFMLELHVYARLPFVLFKMQ